MGVICPVLGDYGHGLFEFSLAQVLEDGIGYADKGLNAVVALCGSSGWNGGVGGNVEIGVGWNGEGE